MAFSFADASSAASGIGGAVSSIFSGITAGDEANSYRTAASISLENKRLAKESGIIQQYQEQRKINNTIGAQQADIAAAGFQQSGDALSLFRDSTTQGAMAEQVIGVQSQIKQNAYDAAAKQQAAEAKAADNTQSEDFLGGALKFVGAIGSVAAMFA